MFLPGEQCRHNETETLAGPDRRDRGNMLRPVMAQDAQAPALITPAADMVSLGSFIQTWALFKAR